jgi:hypothetical protein
MRFENDGQNNVPSHQESGNLRKVSGRARGILCLHQKIEKGRGGDMEKFHRTLTSPWIFLSNSERKTGRQGVMATKQCTPIAGNRNTNKPSLAEM